MRTSKPTASNNLLPIDLPLRAYSIAGWQPKKPGRRYVRSHTDVARKSRTSQVQRTVTGQAP